MPPEEKEVEAGDCMKPAGTPQPSAEPVVWKFVGLYLFSGEERRSDMKACVMKALQEDAGEQIRVEVIWHDIDTLRGGPDHDLSCAERQQHWLDRISSGEFDLIIVSPPCNTWTRALYGSHEGPRPVRSSMNGAIAGKPGGPDHEKPTFPLAP